MPCPVKNNELLSEIIKSQNSGELTPKGLDLIKQMTVYFSKKYKLDLQEEYYLYAIDRIIIRKYWKDLNIDKSINAFAYISQIIKSSFSGYYRKKYVNGIL